MKRHRWLLWAVAALALAGCSLARPEAAGEAEGDRWVGLYVVPSRGEFIDFYANPYLEEYGSTQVDTEELGTLAFPQEVLFAVEDEAGNYVFPGFEEGYSLFTLDQTDEQGHVTCIVSNMAPSGEGAQVLYADEGETVTLGGTIYCGESVENIRWRFFRVYQTEDGRPYLNGHGDSTNGTMATTVTETSSKTENGRTVTDTVKVSVAIEETQRLEKLVVTQFDGGHNALRSDDLALRTELPEVYCEAGAVWVLVEEIGPGGAVRTVYNVPAEGEEPVSHQVVLLNEEGWGELAYLQIHGVGKTR